MKLSLLGNSQTTHPTLSFNSSVAQSVTQKHLGILLDTKLDLQGHLKSIINKGNKTIGLLRKLHNTLPRLPLLTIYKDLQITESLMYCDSRLDDKSNTFILNATIDSLFVTKRFEVNLL